MKLDGDLAAFGLSGVVALLASTHKTGALLLRRGADGHRTGGLWFRDGYVVGASSDLSEQPLVRRLATTTPIDERVLEQAVDAAVAGGHGVARRLMDRGAVDASVVREAATDVTIDAVVDLLQWTEGSFSFDPERREPDDVGVVLAADDLLAQARARADLWGDVAGAIPSQDTVLVLPLAPGDEPRVSREEWAALSLVDGRRTVAQVTLLSGQSPQRVLPVLAGLVRRGLLVPQTADRIDHLAGVERRLALIARLGRDRTATPATPHGTQSAWRDPASEPPSSPGARLRSGPALPEAVPPRTEPTARTASSGAVAMAVSPVLERDPAVNRSLLLRLIAGVRGL